MSEYEELTREEYEKYLHKEKTTKIMLLMLLVLMVFILVFLFYYKKLITTDVCEACRQLKFFNFIGN